MIIIAIISILVFFGIGFAGIGIMGTCGLLIDSSENRFNKRLGSALTWLLLFGGAATGCFLPSFLEISRDITYSYVSPAQIIRTNNVTHVIYEGMGKLRTESYSDARSWNSTNIRVKVKSGKNLWRQPVNKEEISFSIE